MSRERSDDPTRAYDPDDPRLTAYVLGELDPGERGRADRAVVERWLEESTEARTAADEIGDVAALLEAELAREVVPPRETAIARSEAVRSDAVRPVAVVPRTAISARARRGGGAVLAGIASVLALALLVAVVPRGPEHFAATPSTNGFAVADPANPTAPAGHPADGVERATNGEFASGSLRFRNGDARLDGTTWLWDEGDRRLHHLFSETNGPVHFSMANHFATLSTQPPRLNWMGRPADFDSDWSAFGYTDVDPRTSSTTIPSLAYLEGTSTRIVAGGGSAGHWSIENSRATVTRDTYFPYSPSTVLWGTNATDGDDSPAMANGAALGAVANSLADETFFGRFGTNDRGTLDRLLSEERATADDLGRRGEGGDAGLAELPAGGVASVDRWTYLQRGAAEWNENGAVDRFVSPYEAPVSAVDFETSNQSYEVVRNDLANGRMPASGTVRIADFVNAFEYGHSVPESGEAVECLVDAGPCPWNVEHRLVLVRLRGRTAPATPRPPVNYVFAVDVSGSMHDPDKLPVVQQGLLELANRTTAADRLGIVAFGDEANVVLESANGDERERIREAVNGLSAGGRTNVGRGLDVAYGNGSAYFRPDGRNRVVVVTDEEFETKWLSAELDDLIRTNADAGLPLTVLALGSNRTTSSSNAWEHGRSVEQRVASVEDVREAGQRLVEQLDEPMVVAEDVTATVEFNPARVRAYQRLDFDVPATTPDASPVPSSPGRPVLAQSGRAAFGGAIGGLGDARPGGLGREWYAFPNGGGQPSKTDANTVGRPATLGAERSIAQLYEVVPRTDAEPSPRLASLRYQQLTPPADDPARAELLAVRLAYRLPDEKDRIEREFTIPADPASETSSPDLDWAAAVAAYGLVVGKSPRRAGANLELAAQLALDAKGPDPDGRQRRFVETVLNTRVTENWSRGLAPTSPDPLPAEEARARATVDGRYRDLLRTIDVERDHVAYGPFHDWGYWEGTTYAGERDLPKAFWVYVYPTWYLWHERVDAPADPPTTEPRSEPTPVPDSMP